MSEAAGPAVRASYVKNVLAGIEHLGAKGDAIRHRLPDATLTSIECAGPLAWLPIQHGLDVTRCVEEELGKKQTHDLLRGLMRTSYESTPVRGVVHTALGIFGLDAGSLARLVPRAYELLYRECGHWNVHRGEDREVVLELSSIPKRCIEDRTWLESVAHALYALLVIAEAEGDVELVDVDETTRRAKYRMVWNGGGERSV